MFRTMLLASALVAGLAGTALAQGGPRLVGGGENAQVVYDAPSQNIVGGGVASISGGGDNTQIAYGSFLAQSPDPLVAELQGGGENARLVYHRAPAPASQLAGRPLRTGG